MTRLGDLRKGLKDRLATIDGLQPYATMPANPQTPSAAVIPRSVEVPLSWDQDARYRFHIWVYVNAQDFTRAQTSIDEYLSVDGPKSIEAAIEGDPSLGGVANSAYVTGWADYAQIVEIGEAKVLGCRIDIECMA